MNGSEAMLIKCPECGKDVSDRAPSCIHCGYPLQSAPRKIATASTPVQRTLPAKHCTKCGSIYPADDITCPSCGQVESRMIAGNTTPVPTVKCPTCGSTNVERVSAITKAANIWAFGLFGNKRTKQFKCKNCGYMW